MSSVASGHEAEQAVADLLEAAGYSIAAQNWKTPYAEIDIVAQRSGIVYLVEVKYRGGLSAGDGFDYITTVKYKHMTRAAEAWVFENDWQGGYELLVAAVTGEKDSFNIDLREVI